MKNTFAFIISVVFVILFLSGCGQKEIQTPIVNNGAPDTSVTATGEQGITDCKGDQTCLHKNFLACTPATFKIPFIENSEYSITIIGKEDGKCHYTYSVTGSTTSDCVMPMELITEDRFGHFFGQEKVPGKESIAEAQQKMDEDYCTQI